MARSGRPRWAPAPEPARRGDGRSRILQPAEERHRLFEAVVENVNDAVVVTDADLEPPGPRIVYVNPAYTRMTGYAPDEALGRNPGFLQGPDTDRAAVARISAALRRGEPVREELLNYRKDGTPFWVEISIVPVRDAQGRITHFASAQRDTTGRRRAEEELRAATRRLEAVIHSWPLAVVAVDLEARVRLWNPAAERIFGWTAAEVVGRRIPIVPEDRWQELVGEELGAALEGRELRQLETLRRRKDGSLIPVSISAAPTYDDGGRVTGMMGMLEDISARKQAQEALERLRRELELILNTAAEGIYGLDTEGRTTFANPAAARMVGRSREELIGRPQHELIHHSRPDGSRYPEEDCPIYAAYRDGTVHHVDDEVFWRKDGTSFPVEYTSAPIREGERITGAVVTFRDVSERKRAEAAQRFLLEASRRLSGSLDVDATLRQVTTLIVPERADYVVIHLVDEKGEVRTAAAVHRDPERADLVRRAGSALGAVARVLRSGEPELVPEVSDDWLRAASRDPSLPQVLDALRTRSLMLVPLRARERVIGAVTFGLTEPRGNYTGHDLDTAEDLCGSAALALENARLFNDAQQAARIRDEVLRIVAHDLRNPLNTILLSTGVLGELLAADAKERRTENQQIETIRRSVQRADRLIQDLLDVARVEAGTLAVHTARLPAAALAQEAVELHRPLADGKGIRLEAVLADELPAVAADHDRILQVFSNLLDNAIKFTPEGGRVTVRAEHGNHEVIFSVSDTGPGIPEEQRAHLFEPFWQAKHARRAGAGLGLAIARGIVEAHGGWIRVESEVGRGTTVSFSVPAAK
ncbi:MAG TPA: PAS domain S-box protein [Longimicrobiales bacterium]